MLNSLFDQGVVAMLLAASVVSCNALQPSEAYNPPPDKRQASCMQVVKSWVSSAFGDPSVGIGHGKRVSPSSVPFTFSYDGKPSRELLSSWEFSSHKEKSGKSELQINSYKDPKTGLLIECEIRTFPDSAAVDWVCYLSNTGSSDTPIIEGFMPLNTGGLLQGMTPGGPLTLRWCNGDIYGVESFMPHDEVIEQGKTRSFNGGFSSDTYLPFFNIQGEGGGWVLAVGWTGSWMAEFANEPGGMRIRSGMVRTHFRLKPGERVRTPRMALLRWSGDDMVYGHNEFRRLILKHYAQWRNGQLAIPPIGHPTTTVMTATGEMPNEANQTRIISKAAKLGIELYWMDAYWQPQPWPQTLGSWDPRPEDFPNGLHPLADAAHSNGMGFVVWFLAPAVSPGSSLAKAHPEFIHGGSNGGLWKMGDTVAREFMTDYISERIRKSGIDIYREDGSGLPPDEGPEDRQGIAEMKYLEGWYKFWSDLMDRNPGLLIDNCAGGGNRIDLETCARAYVLWRTDFEDVQQYSGGQSNWSNMGRTEQVLTGGLSLYYPLHSGVVFDMNPYGFRSSMSAGIVIHRDIEDKGFPDALCRDGIAEMKALRPLFLGDMYPLLKLTTSQKAWYAYQLDRPDLGEGCVLAFRRPESETAAHALNLYSIDPETTYEVSLTGETYSQGPWQRMSGSDLMRREIRIDEKPGSMLLRYRRLDNPNR